MILAIDPGAHGAVAFLSPSGVLLDVTDMPAIEVKVGKARRTRVATAALAEVIRRHGVLHAFVERVGAMPGQGSASMFAFGHAAGIVEGVLAALGIATTFITPAAWKRAMQVPSDKGACRQRAMQVFPMQADLFRRVKDDGRAEAALLGLHGLRTLGAVS